jgi:hypothetical protein
LASGSTVATAACTWLRRIWIVEMPRTAGS